MAGRVSILIPCHNAEAYVGEAIQSCLSQTWPEIEIIVVDDGSTDQSVARIRAFEAHGVRCVVQPQRGASAARNRAMQEATGAYLQFLDADDVLAPDKISRQMDTARSAPPDAVMACEWARFVEHTDEARFEAEPVWADLNPVEWLVRSWSGGGMMHPGAWLVPVAVAASAGGWDERLSLNDDGEYFARVLLHSAGVRFCRGARTYYRSGNAGSLSGRKSRKAWESGLLSLDLSTRALLAAEDSARTRRACADVMQSFVYDAFPYAGDLAEIAAKRVAALGGSELRPAGGAPFQRVVDTLGWRTAIRLRHRVHHLGYRRAARALGRAPR